jgi:hypothetical protein
MGCESEQSCGHRDGVLLNNFEPKQKETPPIRLEAEPAAHQDRHANRGYSGPLLYQRPWPYQPPPPSNSTSRTTIRIVSMKNLHSFATRTRKTGLKFHGACCQLKWLDFSQAQLLRTNMLAATSVVIGTPSHYRDRYNPLHMRPERTLEIGALGEIRTPDPQIRSLMLYPAELRAHAGRQYSLCRTLQAASPKRRRRQRGAARTCRCDWPSVWARVAARPNARRSCRRHRAGKYPSRPRSRRRAIAGGNG